MRLCVKYITNKLMKRSQSSPLPTNQSATGTLYFEGVDIPEIWATDHPIYLEYISEMEPIQRTALKIAMAHLKTSFDMERSNGFAEWLSARSAESR
jgi:hypothetical protein